MRWIVLCALAATRIAAADPESGKSLVDAYLVTLAATSGPAVAGALIMGDEQHGPRATTGGLLMTAGLVLGPSAGQWYAGEGVTTGLALRFVAAAGVATLAVGDPHGVHVETYFGLVAALGLWETGVVWDLVTLPRAVRRTRITPVVTPSGVAIAGAF